MTRDDLLAALTHDNVQAFLRVIRAGESGQDDAAYQVMFGGDLFEAPPWEHPRKKNTAKGLTSTAAGAYQFLVRTWDEVSQRYGLADFSPANQDLGAVGLIARRGALQDVIDGRLHEAIWKCRKEWASLPGSPHKQSVITTERAQKVYEAYGGKISPSTTPTEPKPMAPILPIFAALLPEIVKLIPALGALFGSGSEVANRNVAAASVIAESLTKATNSPNLQSAVEAMQSDPEALQAAKSAVYEVLPQISEAGGGGIKAARDAAMNGDQIPFWRNPAFLIAAFLSPLIYMVAVEILFNPSGQTWSDDIKMMFVTAIVSGLLGSITGFFLGSSLGSQKKDSMLGRP